MKYILPMTALCSAVLLTACGDDDAPVNEAVKGSISLSGTARVKQLISIKNEFTDRNGIDAITDSYQWYSEGIAISGETNATLRLPEDQLGKDVHVKMDFLDDDGFAETLTSNSVNIYDPYRLSIVLDRGSSLAITYSENYGEEWDSRVIPIASAGELHSSPSVATDEKGVVMTVSTSTNGDYGSDTDIVFTRSLDNGLTWSDISLLLTSSDADSDVNPVVATNKNGTWVVLWSSDRTVGNTGTDTDIFYVTSLNNGETWSDPEPLNPWAEEDNYEDNNPKISINGSIWTVTWASLHQANDGETGGDFEIYSSYSLDMGREWSEPVRISKGGINNDTDDIEPKLHINSLGTGLVIWTGQEDGDDTDIYSARTTNYGFTWVQGEVLNNDTASSDDPSDNEKASSVFAADDGTIVASWYGLTNGTGVNQGSFYVYSSDGGSTWSTTQTLADTIADEITPEFIAKPDGGWMASWVEGVSRKVFLLGSTDLVNWSSTPVEMADTSSSTIGWVIH